MRIKVSSRKSIVGKKFMNLRILAATLAVTSIFPANSTFAEESTGDENQTTLNYLESEDFIFTAERIPTNRWDTPANVHVITAQEIEDNHYQDLYEALSHVNGVAVNLARDTYGMAQLNGGMRVLLLLNGHRLNNTQSGLDTHNLGSWGMIPSMKMIDRIEIVKGAGSALYGTDAVDGIINIITKKGKLNETELEFNAGTWRRYNYELTNQGEVGKFGWFLTGALRKSNPWTPLDISFTTDTENVRKYDNKGLYLRLDDRFDDRNSLTLDFLHYDRDNSGSYTSLFQLADKPDYSLLLEGIRTKTDKYNNVSISYNFKEGSNTPGWLRYFNNFVSGETYTNNGTYNTRSGRIQGLEYQNGWEFGEHKIIAGFEWAKNSDEDSRHGIHDRSTTNTAAYLQDTMKIANKWTLIPGTRYDHNSKYGHQWSPKIAVNYRPDDKTKFYTFWGASYRAPNIKELYTYSGTPMYSNAILTQDVLYIGNSYTTSTMHYLTPEKGNTVSIGVEHNFDDNTNITFNVFRSKIKDTIHWVRGHDANNLITIYAPLNRGEEEAKGVEFAFNQKVGDHFNYGLGYSNIRTKNAVYVNVQPIGYRAGLGYNNRGLKANLLGVMASGRPSGFTGESYGVFDLNVSYELKSYATLYFKLLNLTDEDYRNLDIKHYPGRSFIGGLDVKF